MSTVGWIKVGFAADLAGLAKGTKQASHHVEDWKSSVTKLVAAYAGFEAIKGAGEYVKSTIESIGATKALSDRIGFSTESFQKLGYAARLAHVDQDTLSTKLGQMSKRLGEVAIEGSGPAADVLKRFGVNARELASMGPEKAFGVLLQIFQQISNPMERSAVAMDLFGKSGQSMINIMRMGGPELAHLGEEASRLGIALNGVQVAQAVEAEEAFIKLSSAAQGFANLLAVELAPWLTLVTEKYLEFGYGGQKSANFISTAMGYVAQATGVVVDATYVLQAGFYGLLGVGGMVAQGLVEEFQLTVNVIQGLVDALAKVGGYLNQGLGDALASASAGIKKFSEDVGSYKESIASNTKANFDAAATAINKVGSGRQSAADFIDAVKTGAVARATESAKKTKDFIGEGGDVHRKREEVKFSPTSELGSKESYSAVLQAKGLQSSGEKEMLLSSKITADATSQSLSVLKTISATLTAGPAGAALKLLPDT